jgi:hypothetical protein
MRAGLPPATAASCAAAVAADAAAAAAVAWHVRCPRCAFTVALQGGIPYWQLSRLSCRWLACSERMMAADWQSLAFSLTFPFQRFSQQWVVTRCAAQGTAAPLAACERSAAARRPGRANDALRCAGTDLHDPLPPLAASVQPEDLITYCNWFICAEDYMQGTASGENRGQTPASARGIAHQPHCEADHARAGSAVGLTSSKVSAGMPATAPSETAINAADIGPRGLGRDGHRPATQVLR